MSCVELAEKWRGLLKFEVRLGINRHISIRSCQLLIKAIGLRPLKPRPFSFRSIGVVFRPPWIDQGASLASSCRNRTESGPCLRRITCALELLTMHRSQLSTSRIAAKAPATFRSVPSLAHFFTHRYRVDRRPATVVSSNVRKDAAIGIDLGTTNSSITVCEGGKVRVLPDSIGRQLLPSLVSYTAVGLAHTRTGTSAKPVLHAKSWKYGELHANACCSVYLGWTLRSCMCHGCLGEFLACMHVRSCTYGEFIQSLLLSVSRMNSEFRSRVCHGCNHLVELSTHMHAHGGRCTAGLDIGRR